MRCKVASMLLIVFLVLGCTASESEVVKDCGSDETCILDAMKTCEPAKYHVHEDPLGISLSIETLSKEGSDCKYALNIETSEKEVRVTCIHKDSDSREMMKDVCSNKKTLEETIEELLSDIEEPVVVSEPEPLDMEMYRQYCDSLCSRYIDSNFDAKEAIAYCEKYFEIDLNKNGKIPGEVGIINAYGISEDRVYCLNIKQCSWGSSRNSRLTPEKCKEIMCDVYTERYKNETMAEEVIKRKIFFGESTEPYHEDLIVLDMNGKPILDREGKIVSFASWWIDNFQDLDCPRE